MMVSWKRGRTTSGVALCLAWTVALGAGCFRGGSGGGGNSGGGGSGGSDTIKNTGGGEVRDPVAELNDRVVLPPGSYQADPDTAGTDDTITISGGAVGGELSGGTTMNVGIPFSAPNGNVVAGAIRFGNSGPANVVPINGSSGNTTGQLNFAMQIPPDICDNLSQICHDIKCYEFAVTDAGTFSKANIMDLALVCNNCTEPSCKSLLKSCEPATLCDNQTQSGGDTPEDHRIDLGQTTGAFSVSWNMQTQKDQLTVTFDGQILHDTGCVSNTGTANLQLPAGASSSVIDIHVNPNCEDPSGSGTAWNFSVTCPQ